MLRQAIEDGCCLVCLVYVSTARAGVSHAILNAILESARLWNAEHGITGILIYCDGSFLQYLEGPREQVKQCYERITASTSHAGIVELINEPTGTRKFSHWHMGFTRASRSQLRALLDVRWRNDTGDQHKTGADGIGLLRHLMDGGGVAG